MESHSGDFDEDDNSIFILAPSTFSTDLDTEGVMVYGYGKEKSTHRVNINFHQAVATKVQNIVPSSLIIEGKIAPAEIVNQVRNLMFKGIYLRVVS